MDIIEMSFEADPIGILWALFIGGVAICSVVIVIVVHISFSVAIFRDATSLSSPRRPIFVGPTIWFLGTLLGGIFVATIYWVMHHSSLNQSIAVTPPEN